MCDRNSAPDVGHGVTWRSDAVMGDTLDDDDDAESPNEDSDG